MDYTEFDYAELIFAPNGIFQYFKERSGQFQAKYGVSPSMANIVKIVISNDQKANLSSTQLLQKISTYYNKVSSGEWKKTAQGYTAPEVKVIELIQVFALHHDKAFPGLKEHILKMNGGKYRELVEVAKENYRVEIADYSELIEVKKLIQFWGERHEEQHANIMAAIEAKGKSVSDLEKELNAVIGEIVKELDKHPDSELKRKFKKIVAILKP